MSLCDKLAMQTIFWKPGIDSKKVKDTLEISEYPKT